jgi:hypothetical protein
LASEEKSKMSIVTAPSEAASPGTIATVIVAVLSFSAFLAYMMWRVCRSAEGAERDPKFLRRRLIRWGMLYVFTLVIGIVEVATGKEPAVLLLGLPITALIAWSFFRKAMKIRIPPAQVDRN